MGPRNSGNHHMHGARLSQLPQSLTLDGEILPCAKSVQVTNPGDQSQLGCQPALHSNSHPHHLLATWLELTSFAPADLLAALVDPLYCRFLTSLSLSAHLLAATPFSTLSIYHQHMSPSSHHFYSGTGFDYSRRLIPLHSLRPLLTCSVGRAGNACTGACHSRCRSK